MRGEERRFPDRRAAKLSPLDGSEAAPPSAFKPAIPPFVSMSAPAYTLVPLANGVFSIRSEKDGETFHPVAGPVAEAESLYVGQLRLRERAARFQAEAIPDQAQGEFAIWDVGLGAGGNVMAAVRGLEHIRASIRIVSFDHTLAALSFARDHAGQLGFPCGFEGVIDELLATRRAAFRHGALEVDWQVYVSDFPGLIAEDIQLPAPDAVFFDAFSPARNPEMWTLPLFETLFHRLDPGRPCSLATFSRSTIARVTMLVAGFFVGVGQAVPGKEETTIASNTPGLIDRPLGAQWLARAQKSHSAEPLLTPEYCCGPLTAGTLARLRLHPQFAGNSHPNPGAETSHVPRPGGLGSSEC